MGNIFTELHYQSKVGVITLSTEPVSDSLQVLKL